MRRLTLREGRYHQPGSRIHLLGWQLPELVAAVPTEPLGSDALAACRRDRPGHQPQPRVVEERFAETGEQEKYWQL